jgi:hypothetical protein
VTRPVLNSWSLMVVSRAKPDVNSNLSVMSRNAKTKSCLANLSKVSGVANDWPL